MKKKQGPIKTERKPPRKIRYAVVGLGHIAQTAMLPAFDHAENSVLTAFVSGDPKKLDALSDKYQVQHTYDYGGYERCLNSGLIDAVYIAVPNSMHRDMAVRAAHAGMHVLCEKPMAVNERQCREMIDAAAERHVRLMVAYRLHFEEASLKAAEIAQSGRLGEVRSFNSTFALPVEKGNIRLKKDLGGGTLYDIGIYCINAARLIFRAEPTEVLALTASGDGDRFGEVDEMTGAVLRFPGERLASFTTSFGTARISWYQIAGTQGDLRVEPAYSYAADLQHHLTINEKTTVTTFPQRDQFAPQLIHFSKCILEEREPGPGGLEGLADVRIIEALYRSARERRSIHLDPIHGLQRPSLKQAMKRPPVEEPEKIRARSPTGS